MRRFGERLCQLKQKAIFLERRIGAAYEPVAIRRHDETWIVDSVVDGASESIVPSRSGYRMSPAKALSRIIGRRRRHEVNYLGLAHREL
jgi:hypothetical protein